VHDTLRLRMNVWHIRYIAVIALRLGTCFAQASESTSFQHSASQLRLEISLTNTFVIRGSSFKIYLQIQNSSTNSVATGSGGFAPIYKYNLKMRDSRGVLHDPVPRGPGGSINANGAYLIIRPGATCKDDIPVLSLNPALARGEYEFLAAAVVFYLRNGEPDLSSPIEVKSNRLKVEVR
jgi:hypothetical protein